MGEEWLWVKTVGAPRAGDPRDGELHQVLGPLPEHFDLEPWGDQDADDERWPRYVRSSSSPFTDDEDRTVWIYEYQDPASVVDRFSQLARAYCAALEDPESTPAAVVSALGNLVGGASQLPNLEPDTEDEAPIPRDLAADVARVRQSLRGWLHIDYYWTVVDPVIRDDNGTVPEAAAGHLCEDLVETYSDLRVGLALVDVGLLHDALFEWRFGFLNHWGRHATDALRVLWESLPEGP